MHALYLEFSLTSLVREVFNSSIREASLETYPNLNLGSRHNKLKFYLPIRKTFVFTCKSFLFLSFHVCKVLQKFKWVSFYD